MFRSLVIAISTYSKIPMPRFEWKEEDMRYSMCFFPVVGGIISLLIYAIFYGLRSLSASSILIATVVTVIPVFITGGIHMDGFLDTIDAKSSYAPTEKKLEILKDPHTGAFAIIYGIAYMIIWFGIGYELCERGCITKMILIFPLSRMLSALSVVFFKKAKKDGMVSTFSKAADEKKTVVKVVLLLELFVYSIFMILYDWKYAIGILVVAFLVMVYYYIMSHKTFGGVTGDLAGYFLQICELMCMIAVFMVNVLCTFC